MAQVFDEAQLRHSPVGGYDSITDSPLYEATCDIRTELTEEAIEEINKLIDGLTEEHS